MTAKVLLPQKKAGTLNIQVLFQLTEFAKVNDLKRTD